MYSKVPSPLASWIRPVQAMAPSFSAEKSTWQRSRNRSSGGFELAQSVALAVEAFIASCCATQSGRAQLARHQGLAAQQQQRNQNRGSEDHSAEQRDLPLRQRHDPATRRSDDKTADHQQHPQRPLKRTGASEVADKGLITLNAAADEQGAEGSQRHQAEPGEIGAVALQHQRRIEHEEERNEIDDAADPHR